MKVTISRTSFSFGANGSCEEILPLLFPVKHSTAIECCTLGIQTPLQLTTVNVLGAL